VVAASADRADVSSITRAAHVLMRFLVRSFSTNSRPALRTAACGGRPRAGNHTMATGGAPAPPFSLVGADVAPGLHVVVATSGPHTAGAPGRIAARSGQAAFRSAAYLGGLRRPDSPGLSATEVVTGSVSCRAHHTSQWVTW
jgi:hypothetical protein